MLLSIGCTYGIQAMLLLDSLEPKSYLPVSRIAKQWDVSPTFLSKIIRRLVSAGLLLSVKGPGGGVRLARPAAKISLLNIVQAVDGRELCDECILFHQCGDFDPCPMHLIWEPIREDIMKMLSSKSLHDLATAEAVPPQKLKNARTGKHAR